VTAGALGLPLLGILVTLWVPALAGAPPAAAAEMECSGAAPSPGAEALMGTLESEFRRGVRIVRMDIRTHHAQQRRASGIINTSTQKTLWGVFSGDPDQTRFLYVFSGPGRLAGTTLLMHDSTEPDVQDAMWLYLRSFEIFKKLDVKTQRVLVPGTALSYEDSRGFIPLDKYRFSFVGPGPDPGSADAVELLGCPRTDSIRDQLGYGRLRVTVDPAKRVVTSVRYSTLGGRPLKTYTLVRSVQVADRFFPAAVRLEHIADGFTTEIDYEYWLPDAAPAPELFEPSIDQTRFIDRLTSYLTLTGQGDRIRAELAQADEEFRRFEERLRRIQEAERTGKPFRQEDRDGE
jgi:hypothetical protein